MDASAQTPVADLAKKYAPLLIGAGAVAASTQIDFPPWAIDMLKQWGPAGILILLFAWYVPRTAVTEFISSQQAQAAALTALAENVKQLPQKDHMKFEEILLGQQMMLNSVDRLHNRLDGIEERFNGQAPSGK